MAQSARRVYQNHESQSTHEYDSDEEEGNLNHSLLTSEDKGQHEPSYNNTIRCDKTEPQQVNLTDAGLWPEIINNDTRMILVQ